MIHFRRNIRWAPVLLIAPIAAVAWFLLTPNHSANAETVANVPVTFDATPSDALLIAASNDVVAAHAGTRLTGLHVDADGSLAVSTSGSDVPDALRSIWYGGLVAAQVATDAGLPADTAMAVSATLADGSVSPDGLSGHVSSLAAPGNPGGVDAAMLSSIRASAANNGATVASLRGIAIGAGAVDLVLQVPDPKPFLATAAERLGAILGDAGRDHLSYFVVVEDGSGSTDLELGFISSFGGDTGTGMAWVTPGLQTDAIAGSTDLKALPG